MDRAPKQVATVTLLVADGASCRHQIHDGLRTGEGPSLSVAQRVMQREAVHVAQVPAQALDAGAGR